MNLNGKTFRVASTAAGGVVSGDTRLHCTEVGTRIFGRYAGGTIARGCLVGTRTDTTFAFRFVQREADGQIHAGHSVCELRTHGGLVTIAEHFTWETRIGSGVNIFEEVLA